MYQFLVIFIGLWNLIGVWWWYGYRAARQIERRLDEVELLFEKLKEKYKFKDAESISENPKEI